MNRERKVQLIGTIMTSLVLLLVPLFTNIYYPIWYYIGLVCLMGLGIYREVAYKRYEKKFYQKWNEARKRGFAFNMIWQSARAALLLIGIVVLFQLFSYGLVWSEWLLLLTPTTLIASLIIVVTLGVIAGIYSWTENEKRYREIEQDDSKYSIQQKPHSL